jgi:hypothetical protein
VCNTYVGVRGSVAEVLLLAGTRDTRRFEGAPARHEHAEGLVDGREGVEPGDPVTFGGEGQVLVQRVVVQDLQ